MLKYIFLFSLFTFRSSLFTFSQCTLTASPSQTNVTCYGANNGTASANASGGTAPYTYNWSNGQTTPTIANLAPGNYSVTVTDASCIISGIELVTNGDFSAGNTGFSSSYSYCNWPGCMGPEGTYAVNTNPNVFNGGFCACGDHTSGSGNFMIVNGAGTPGLSVWCQTIAVTPNTNYDFSTWVTSLNGGSPALLQFSINGIPLGGIFLAPSTGVWQQFFSVWNSGANTSATICIVNQNTTLGGNDFGLDDISFQTCTPCTTTANITITEPPVLSITTGSTTNEFCNRADGTASVAATGGTGAFSYLWNPSAQISSTATGLAAGNYSVTVSDANGCTHDTVLTVNFTPGPTATAGADATVCAGFSASLNSSGGGTYLWSPSTGLNNPAVSDPVATPAATTIYTVTVTDANNCSASDDLTVTVNPKPAALFSATNVCFNNPTVFTDQSSGGTIAQWDWNFGDGNIDSIQNPGHTYNNSGSFVVTLIVTTAEGCKDTSTLTVDVYPLPTVNFSSTSVCKNNPTCFTDSTTISSGSITTWSWNFDDPNSGPNNISNSQNPCHTYTASATYNVVLTVTSDKGCQSTTILPVTVLSPPVAAFTAPDVCLNSTTAFSDASTGASNWFWAFGDGGTSTSQNPSHNYLGYGNYIVTLIVSSGGTCVDTAYDTAKVNPLPVVNFSSDTVCQGDSTLFMDLSFIPSGSITNWSWNFGDGDTSSLQNPIHAYTSSGNYNASLTCTSNNNCSSSVSLSVMVHPLPLADFSTTPSPTGELIDEVVFTDLSTGGVVNWLWNFGDSATDSAQSPSHIYSDTGIYIVTLIVTSANGCLDTVIKPFEIKDFSFYIPNTFTPNGDGVNDFFFGEGIGITDYEMSIFDRWGNIIFYCNIKGLPQSNLCRWNGVVKGGTGKIQEDVYVYKVHFTSAFKQEYTFVGNVNLVK